MRWQAGDERREIPIRNQIPVRDTVPMGPVMVLLFGFLLVILSHAQPAQGQSVAHDRLVAPDSAAGRHYVQQVQPVLEQRCVVCHGCYDSPCQFNQGAVQGIDRGASSERVYNGGRLSAIATTRLLEDARPTSAWREMGFYPMLNEFEQSPENNLNNSVLYQLLALKREHPLPKATLLDKSFDFSLNRKQECPKLENVDRFKKKHPLWGMPYALPGLADDEFNTLEQWLEGGSLMALPAPAGAQTQAAVARWERFLNGQSLKERLMSRYLYEHWFLAHLHFPEVNDGEFFRIVRSSTPPGEPISHLSTRRPYDNPGVARIYYRLSRDHSTVLDKTHMPYALDAARMNWLRGLFLAADYEVTALPSYAPDVAANPFVVFSEIPVASRWRFLLQEAQFTIMNFIKGPVCRGQTSLNVIRDHFWVFFNSPDVDVDLETEAVNFLKAQENNLSMPSAAGSNAKLAATWKAHSKSQEIYLQGKSAAMKEYFPDGFNLDALWDGGGDNQNAALTVFRHFDSASVVRGLVGDEPLTAWVIDYPIMERIHYLLAAGFDVFGAVGHQLSTRLYMDFLRLEGEFNFLALLPPEARLAERARWYEGASAKQQSYLFGSRAQFDQPTGISYTTGDPKRELYAMLRDKLAPALNHAYDLDQNAVPALHRQALQRIAAIEGMPASRLPEVVFLNVLGRSGKDYYYTLLHNTAHTNVTSLFKEEKNLKPEEDSIVVIKGFIGSYPDAYWIAKEEELLVLANRLQRLAGEADYRALVDRFGVRRTSPDFWSHSDKIIDAHHRANPLENGLLDYNRLDNR